jgi:hypothetical protein
MTFATPVDGQHALIFSCAAMRKLGQSNLRLSVCVLLVCNKVETKVRTNMVLLPLLSAVAAEVPMAVRRSSQE